MELVDTSAWIEHFRQKDSELTERLLEGTVLTHPFVIGELACGNLKHRAATLANFQKLPQSLIATPTEVMHLLESRRLYGRGLGWVDLNLLASALLSGVRLRTHDRRLAQTAAALGLW